jgi:hypothetical protein
MNTHTDGTMASKLRAILLDLARHQDNMAADQASSTPYWAPCPPSVLGHRSAAAALRAQADQLLAAS